MSNDPIENAVTVAETNEEAIARLAQLQPLDYETVRESEAKKLGIKRVSVLDKEVEKARKQGEENSEVSIFPETNPWEEPIELAELLEDIRAQIKRFIICAPETANATTLWIAFTWVIDHVQVSPIANITAPEMQCGKSQLLSVISAMVKKPAIAANISPSVVFRVIEKYCPTLLIDEADSFMNGNEDLRGIINSGHTRQSAYVWRSVGDDHEPTQFSTWSAKALCGIGAQAATIMDRSIILELRRKLPHEKVERLRHADKQEFLNIKRKLARFALDSGEAIENSRPALPDALSDRAQDNWEPLLAIADIAGNHWPETARQSAMAIYAKGQDDDNQAPGIMLLHDIQDIFEGEKLRIKITSADLLEKLLHLEDRPWSEWNRGHAITSNKIARYLKPFGVSPKTIRTGSTTAKGYMKDDFEDAITRYIPVQSVTPSQPNETNTYSRIQTVTNIANVTNEFLPESPENSHCYGVTALIGVSGEAEEF